MTINTNKTINTNNKQNKQNMTNTEIIDSAFEQIHNKAIVNKTQSLSIEEVNSLVNRLSLKQLETLQRAFAERCKAETNKAEKEVLTARKMELSDLNIKAVAWLLQQPETTAEELKTLKAVYFDNSFLTAIAAVQPAAKTGKEAKKHNKLSHEFKLLITRFSYQKEANCDSFNFKDIQPFEPLTLADFTVHCQKNTFANNTVFPVVIDGQQFADKQAAVEAMAEKMFNWYTQAIGATVADCTGA